MASEAQRLEEIRRAIARHNADWRAGANRLTRLSAEARRRRLGFVPGPHDPSLAEREAVALRNQQSPTTDSPDSRAALGVPTAYDLRNVDGQNYITPVRDQGDCGSCVAFGTLAAAEGTYRVALKNPNLEIDYSEAHLFHCHARREGRTCGNGWWVDRALEAVKNSGVVDERCCPYTAGAQNCPALCDSSPSRLTRIENWRRYVTAASMKLWLCSEGPLIACLTVYEDFFAYTTGAYRHVWGEEVGGHCVCVVGYDDEGGYWICKNSWGEDWGERGFFRVRYGAVGIDAEMWTVEGIRSPFAVRDAAFVSQSLPTAMVPGQGYDVAVTLRNTGIQTWTRGSNYRLGSQNPQDNMVWGLGRVDVPHRVPTWGEATFAFRVTAPAQLPAHHQWRMVQDGVEWFGGTTPDVLVEASGVSVRHGATLRVRHAMTWANLHSHPYVYGHPGSSGQQQVTCYDGADDNDLWIVRGPDGTPSDHRVGQQVSHGDLIRLEHMATRRNLHSHGGVPSPVTGQQEVTCFGEGGQGDGNDTWRVEIEGGGTWQAGRRIRLIHVATGHALHSHRGHAHPDWTMGQQEVTCFAGRDANDLWFASDFRARDALFVAQSVPTTMVRGQSYDVTVTMCNVGTETWTAADSHRLGSQSPQDNQTWGPARVELPRTVAPGEHVTFAFRVTAPAAAGVSHFQWRMLREGAEWFGALSARTPIRVYTTTEDATVPDATGLARNAAGNLIRDAELVPRFTGAQGARVEVGSQEPGAGTKVRRGGTVTLRMVHTD
ncbi:C1 family peptidase [Streptomyces typhae]|nr:C1 family peptidase [Streptomyces typhae]